MLILPSLSLWFLFFRQKTPGTANHEGPVPTGLWDALALSCSSTSPLATRPSRPKSGKPRAPGQVAARTGEGLARLPAHLLPLHRPHPPPLSPPCRPAPLPPPPKRRRPLPPHHHSSSSSSSWQCRPSEVRARQPARVVWLVRGRGSGGGVLKGGTPPRCAVPRRRLWPCLLRRRGEAARPAARCWPRELGRCPLY